MKKLILFFVTLMMSWGALLSQGVTTTPTPYPIRGPFRIVYNRDTIDMYFSGDTAKFKTDKAFFVFNQPIKVNKDAVVFRNTIDSLINIIAGKEPSISTTSDLYYWRGDKEWAIFPSSMPASDVYPWAKEPEKPIYTAAEVGLSDVDNTADLDKPVSLATQDSLDLKAPVNNPDFTGTVTGVTKAMVGLGNADNTSDTDKPISTAAQTALDAKEGSISLSTALYYWRGDKTWQLMNKTAVGLGNADNTSDTDKPISTAAQTALDGKLAIDGTAINSELFAGKDSVYWKTLLGVGSGGGDFSWPANTTGQDVLVGRSADNTLIYYSLDSVEVGGGGGTSLNGTGFVKATGTTITYDNTAYQPFINTATSPTTLYYRGDKSWQTLPIYTGSNGIQKSGNNFALGGQVSGGGLDAVNNTVTWGLGIGTEDHWFNALFWRTKNSSGKAFMEQIGQTITFGSDNHNQLLFDKSASYTGDYTAYQTGLNSIPSLRKVVKSIHDTVANNIFPPNTTGKDVLVGLGPANQKLYFTMDSLFGGTTLNGTGYVKMLGGAVIYDDRMLQTALSGTGFLKFTGTTPSYDNTTYQPLIAAGTTAQYWRGDKSWQTLNKAAVGLGSVDNTTDATKPISTATQTALNGKEASLGNPSVNGYVLSSTTAGVRSWIQLTGGSSHNPLTIGTANGLSLSTQVLSLGLATTSTTGALSSADWNTFNSKVTFPGYGTSHTTAAYGDHNHSGVYQPSGSYQTALNGTGLVRMAGTTVSYDNTTYQPLIGSGTTAQYWRGDKTWATLPTSLPASDVYAWAKASVKPTYNKTEIGLTNVDNTADLDKPVSNAVQSELNLMNETLYARRPQMVYSSSSQVSTSGTAATVLVSTTLDANLLAVNGDALRITYYETSSSAGTGYSAVSLGGVLLGPINDLVSNPRTRSYIITIIRTGPSALKYMTTGIGASGSGGGSDFVYVNTPSGAAAFNTALLLQISSTMSSGNCRKEAVTVEFLPSTLSVGL